VVEPALVIVGVVAKVEEAGFCARRVGLGRTEPVVTRADVVDGEVSDHADPPVVARLHQPGEGVVAAEQRVDVFERVGVVAVARRGGKERCQVQTAHRERLQVVEAGLDPLQVAAVHLANGAPPVSVDAVVPR
jgi:hypothetical protein